MARKTKTSETRKRRKKICIVNPEYTGLSSKDLRSCLEARAIRKMEVNGNVRQPQLNKFYTCDGVKFGTGFRHRGGGWYV